MPNIIPTVKLVGGIIVAGILYYFLNLFVYEVLTLLNRSHTYWDYWIWLWIIVPIAIFIASAGWYLQTMQKKSLGGM